MVGDLMLLAAGAVSSAIIVLGLARSRGAPASAEPAARQPSLSAAGSRQQREGNLQASPPIIPGLQLIENRYAIVIGNDNIVISKSEAQHIAAAARIISENVNKEIKELIRSGEVHEAFRKGVESGLDNVRAMHVPRPHYMIALLGLTDQAFESSKDLEFRYWLLVLKEQLTSSLPGQIGRDFANLVQLVAQWIQVSGSLSPRLREQWVAIRAPLLHAILGSRQNTPRPEGWA